MELIDLYLKRKKKRKEIRLKLFFQAKKRLLLFSEDNGRRLKSDFNRLES